MSRGSLAQSVCVVFSLVLFAACDAGAGDPAPPGDATASPDAGSGGADVHSSDVAAPDSGRADTGLPPDGAPDAAPDGPTCGDECLPAGARQCAGNAVVVCDDHDGDGCLEWDAGVDCGAERCVNGACEAGCTPECAVAGEQRCAGAPSASVVETCADHDGDACLEWGFGQDCGTAPCEAGQCVACADDCATAGERRCAGSVVETCGDHDADPCVEWGALQDCGAAGCLDGRCTDPCADECTTPDSRRCLGNAIQQCGNHDADPCLEWGRDADCGALVCADGVCAAQCTAECTVDGATRCDGARVQTCGQHDADTCLEWDAGTACPAGETCSGGACAATCQDECTVTNARRCSGSSAVERCGAWDGDPCLEWGGATACEPGESCTNGQCAAACTSECATPGALRCDGNAVSACGDPDGDGCLTWGTPVACAAGRYCSNGECLAECLAECSAVGATRCLGASVQTCGDPDGDGCLTWGTAVPCETGQACSAGRCVVSCVSECTAAGARRCSGAAVETCGDANGDGCLEWSTPVACTAGETCSGGVCSVTCSDECTTGGARRCDGAGVQTCGQTDGDPCLEWGTTVACDAGQTCSNGNCTIACSDECTTAGAKQCSGAAAVQTCGDANGDGCLEWGTAVACADGQVCSGGVCALDCVPECTVAGARQCDETGLAYQTCGLAAGEDCLRWGDAVSCPANTVCADGQCAATCTNACTALGGRRCAGSGAYEECADHNGDGCLDWGSSVPCPAGQTCSDGVCALVCGNECASAGTRECAGATSWHECGDYDTDDCLEWGTSVACAAGQACSGGACVATCTSTCGPVGAKRCNGTSTGVETCSDTNADGCLEWGTAVPCGAGATCSGGACVTTCSSTCGPVGATRCNGAATGVETCADTNADGCLEWGAAVPCGDGATCEDGACVAGGPPGRLLISEVLYDGVASEADTFVELWGDPGLALDGFTLVGVNGNGGGDYQAIALSGSVPSDGYLVIAPPTAMAAIRDHADILNASADYQNGPDSVQLRWGATVVDALGYGGFGSAVFAGEGAPAPDVAAGHSLARSAALDDTDDNAVDFTDEAVPTPGAPPGAAPSDPPTVVIVRPAADRDVTQGERVLVDASVTPGDGRTVTRVELLADGVVQGAADTVPPWQFDYTVPAAATTGSVIALTARATDDTGARGTSAPRRLTVRNDLPLASFVARIAGVNQVSVDASGSSDTETAAADLQVRWDWQDDGTFDTAWSTTKTATHTYASGGAHTIALAVRDGAGQVSEVQRVIDFGAVRDVAGAITDTEWSGTVNLTGDTWLPLGASLRIAPGTTIAVVPMDLVAPLGTGDYGLTIHGSLSVEGTAEAPVVFTVYGDPAPRAWNTLEVAQDAGTVTIRHAIIESADVGVTLRKPATLEDVEVRGCRVGVGVWNLSAPATLTRVNVHDHLEAGLYLRSGEVVATDLTARRNGGDGIWALSLEATTSFTGGEVSDNGGHGFWLDDSTAALSELTIARNGLTGVHFMRRGGGTMRRCQLVDNEQEGVRAILLDATAPASPPDIQWCNFSGNGLGGSLVTQTVELAATTDAAFAGTRDSAPFATPNGEIIQAVETIYTETDQPSDVRGAVMAGGTSILSDSTPAGPRWLYVGSRDATSVFARVTDESTSAHGQMTIRRVAWVSASHQRQLSVLSRSAKVLAHHNWFDTWPDVTAQLTWSDGAHLEVDGFVGVPFDASWSPGIYQGGTTLAGAVTWDRDVFVTGKVRLADGATLTVQPGVTVRFVPTDLNRDGAGDYAIERGTGTLHVAGTQAAPVTFTTLGTAPAGGFQYVGSGAGPNGTSTVTWGVFETGVVGFAAGGGSNTLSDSIFRDNTSHGLTTRSGSCSGARLLSEDNGGDGVSAGNASVLTLSRLTARRNAGWGLAMVGSPSATNALSDSTLSDNTAGGVFLDGSACRIEYNDILNNGFGVRLKGQASGAITYNDILYNDLDGIYATFYQIYTPSSTINNNNIYGNGVEEAGLVTTVNVSTATTDAFNGGAQDSTVWSTGGPPVEFIEISYWESGETSVAGEFRSGSTTLLSVPSERAATWYDVSEHAVSSVYARVVDTTVWSRGTATLITAFHHAGTASPARIVELSAVLKSGSLDARNNYWGVFGADVATRLVLAEPGTVDFTGFRSTPVAGTGPR